MKSWLALSWLTFALACFAAPIDEIESNLADPEYRLNDKVLPSHYDIQIKPYLLESDKNRFSFDGETSITIKTTEKELKEIVLHAKNLDNLKATLSEKDNGANTIQITLKEPDVITDKLVISLDKAMTPGTDYALKFTYVGQMDEDMRGFYRSKYVDKEGHEVYIGSTQFQPVHARRAFPCFDEPKFKATFVIKIDRPNTFHAVSNTKLDKSILGQQRTIDHFKKTPEMSTYLIAFLVSNFKPRGNDNFTVIARPEAYDQTRYSYDIGQDLLQELNEFTGYPYNTMKDTEKMDLAAIPDFSAGAMENWGLLTYRETALLYKQDKTTAMTQQKISAVIAHEMAHMWFGDLVTCDWWGYTWLNEGFARYFQYFIPHEVNPEWELDKQFVVEQIQGVFNMDSLENTHPMSDETIKSPADIAIMFDSISYNKGASIIRMIKHAMGEQKFKTALQKYLKANEYGTSTPTKLFKAFTDEWKPQEVVFLNLLNDWTTQVGYPVVTLKLGEDKKTLKITQNRFLLRKESEKAEIYWNIPFTYTTNDKPDFTKTEPELYLPKNKNEYKYILAKPTEWIIGNIQQTGYYRVNYEEDMWHKIHHALEEKDFSGIHEINRAQIVDDLLNFGQAGLLDYKLVLNILEYLKKEDNYLPWYSAFNGLSTLAIRMGAENNNVFRRYVDSLLSNVYKKLGFEKNVGESRLDTYNREKVVAWACKYDNDDCINQAVTYFDKFLNNQKLVPVNIRSAVYCTAIRQGGDKEFDFLWNQYKEENVATEQVLILTALGCSKSEKKLQEYLEHITSSDIRLQDKSSALSAAYTGNPKNVDIVFKHVTEKYKDFKTAFGSYSDVASIISSIASRFTKEEQHKTLKEFYDTNKKEFGDAAKTLENAIKNVERNLRWSEENLPKLLDYFKVETGSASTKSLNIAFTILMVLLAMMRYY